MLMRFKLCGMKRKANEFISAQERVYCGIVMRDLIFQKLIEGKADIFESG